MEITTRQHARDVGLKRYFPGTQCQRWHVAEHYKSTGGCIECSLETSREYRRGIRRDVRPKPRQEALKKGLKTYFTGNYCANGHIAKRYVKSKQCIVCARKGRVPRIFKKRREEQSHIAPLGARFIAGRCMSGSH